MQRKFKKTKTIRESADRGGWLTGVINTFEDSEDDEAYTGEQKEIQREVQELRAVESWINQEGWDADAEARAWSPKTERVIDLRLDWGEVKRKLSPESGPQQHQPLRESVVFEE